MVHLSTLLPLLLLLHLASPLHLPSPPNGTFRAAVYEHVLVEPMECKERTCSREEAIAAMEVNLAVLEEQVGLAAEGGASIVLLPEDAIHGSGYSRAALRPFLDRVPASADGSTPCTDDGDSDSHVLRRLSCVARDTGVYLAAQLATIAPGCEHCGEDHGPECYFNTLVVLDRRGRLVGVYHKYNLWTSELNTFDIDPQGPQIVTVDTELGRLGLAVCADLMWRTPVTDLAELYGVDTLLLPLYWWDLFPHQLSHSAEAAWARGLQVNLLAANVHDPSYWNSGSGIFTPNGPAAYYHDLSPGSQGRLVMADLAIHPAKQAMDWSEFAGANIGHFPSSDEGEFSAVVYGDLYTLVGLQGREGRARVCQGDFCCLAHWQVGSSDPHTPDVFSLGVFNGPHTRDGSVRGSWWMQMCTVIKCDPSSPLATCSQDQSWDLPWLTSSSTTFTNLTLAATFAQEASVFPEVLWDSAVLEPSGVVVHPDGRLEAGPALPLLSMALFGRDYTRDAPIPGDYCPAS